METEHLATLERLRQNQRQDYLAGSVTGSLQATDRLMKELRDIYRSHSFKNNMYSIGESRFLRKILTVCILFFGYSVYLSQKFTTEVDL